MKIQNLLTTVFFLVAYLTASEAQAKSVNESLELLKTNAENSQTNYDQFKKNEAISANNAKEATRAIEDLKKLEKTLLTNKGNIENNKAKLDKMKLEVAKFKAAEAIELKKEEASIEQVKAILAKLEANKAKRMENMSAYDQKIVELETEKQNWDAQRSIVNELQTEITTKTAAAQKEKTAWEAKRNTYSVESKKWQKQAATSNAQHQRYNHLKEK